MVYQWLTNGWPLYTRAWSNSKCSSHCMVAGWVSPWLWVVACCGATPWQVSRDYVSHLATRMKISRDVEFCYWRWSGSSWRIPKINIDQPLCCWNGRCHKANVSNLVLLVQGCTIYLESIWIYRWCMVFIIRGGFPIPCWCSWGQPKMMNSPEAVFDGPSVDVDASCHCWFELQCYRSWIVVVNKYWLHLI